MELQGQDKLADDATEPSGSAKRGSPDDRFLYPSGSRPLEGYTIKRGVGHGGFGEVYYATSDGGKEVALKLIRCSLDIELRGIKQCLNLKHHNLLSIHDIREDARGNHWVVMEYLAGGCLGDEIAAHPKGLPTEEALAWIHGIGAGVAYLHDHGIVHRDLKPGNIFCDEGMVKIGDYGLSKFVSCSRRSGQTQSIGTVHYMAPEVANGRYGKEIDIYAMGIVFYEMLTGRVPFEGESVGEILMKHLTATPDVSRLPEPYRRVVARALEKDPARRFKTVGEMLASLPCPVEAVPRMRPHIAAAVAAADPAAEPDFVPVEAVDEEPIFEALRRACRNLNQTWNESHFNTPTKFVLILVGLFTLIAFSGTWIPLGIFLLFLYGGYRLVRLLVVGSAPSSMSPHRPVTPAPPPPQHPAASPFCPPPQHNPAHHPQNKVTRRHRYPKWYHAEERAAEALVVKPMQQRMAELIGSMLGGTLVAMTMCLVMVILTSFLSDLPAPEQCAWLLITSIAGTWAVLVPSKFWEGVKGETMLRRFVMMTIGLGLGLLAFYIANLLMLNFGYYPSLSGPLNENLLPQYNLPASFYNVHGQPLVLAYLAVFGTLMLVLRWWRQADPLRRTRLSLWSMFITVGFGMLVAAVWHFPQPWIAMMACTISVSVQIASPWVHPKKRRELPEAI